MAELPAVHPIGPPDSDWPTRGNIDATARKAWIDDGFVVLERVFDAPTIARYNATVAAVRAQVDDGKDAHGLGDRIGQLHQKEPGLLELAAAPRVLDFLRWALGDEPVVMGSLNFERGTQQEAHIDAIFFWPEPCWGMAGVWIALEDITSEAGPLFYIPGSHRWPFFHSDDVARGRPEVQRQRELARSEGASPDAVDAAVGAVGNAWTEDFLALERARAGRRVSVSLRAGDAVVWHSLLAHGGGPRADPTRSRRSVVFHYLGREARLYTFQQFAVTQRGGFDGLAPSVQPLGRYGTLAYRRFPYFVTYDVQGRQLTHPLPEATPPPVRAGWRGALARWRGR